MDFAGALFSDSTLWTLSIMVGIGYAMALWFAPWRLVVAAPERQHALFGGGVGICLLWLMQMQWAPGLSLHFLAVTSLTVVFGWSLTLMVGAVAQTVLIVMGRAEWVHLPLDLLFSVVIPATVTLLILRFVLSIRSDNLFWYLLGVGFAGAMLGVLVSIGLMLLLILFDAPEYLFDGVESELGILILYCYAEGFINGMLVTAVTVFYPDLVKTFDNRKYLGEE